MEFGGVSIFLLGNTLNATDACFHAKNRLCMWNLRGCPMALLSIILSYVNRIYSLSSIWPLICWSDMQPVGDDVAMFPYLWCYNVLANLIVCRYSLKGWVMRTCTKCWSMLLPQTFVGAFGSLLYSKHGLNHFPFGCYYSCCNLLHFLLTTNKYILVHVHHSIYSREMIASHFGESGAAHCNGMCDICQRQIHYPALEYINIDVSAYAASIVTLAKDAMNLERPITLLQIGACNLCMWCDWLT